MKRVVLDDIFRLGLGEPADAAYLEEDWNALELVLNRSKKRRGLVFWLPVLSSAAIFLILFGWWALRPAVIVHQQKQQAAIHQPKTKSPENKTALPGTVVNPVDKVAVNTIKSEPIVGKQNAANIPKDRLDDRHPATNSNAYHKAADTADNPHQRQVASALVAFNPGLNFNPGVAKQDDRLAAIQQASIAGQVATVSQVKHTRAIARSVFFAHPNYDLSVIGAPEVNGISSSGQQKSGANVGLLFSAGLFKRLTISTGAMYAIKPYNAFTSDYANSHLNSGITAINADCRVLDIPINVDYQLYNHRQNKFSIGSGISSYIMLHESYQFNYGNPDVNAPVSFTVPHDNKYLLGVLNLQATYNRQVAANIGLSIQPYLKLPLNGIGIYQAKLQTTGVAVGLTWNINSASKP